MSENRRVKFTSPSTPRGILKHSEPHPRDSGVGSSSSDHTGSSGSLDDKFTDRDYNIQSNNVDALREALSDAIKDIEYWKNKFNKKEIEHKEARKKHRSTETLYEKALNENQTLETQVVSLRERMENQDTALEVANVRIADLEEDLAEWKDKYENLDEIYQSVKHSANVSVVSGGSGDHSLGLEIARTHRDKRDSKELTSRMKERINRDQTDSGSSQATTRSSRSAETNTSSKRTGHRTSAPASDSSKPYIEPMPRNTSTSTSTALASPRQAGSYKLTTADRRTETYAPSSSRRLEPRPRHRDHEQGDYIAYPLSGGRSG